MDLAWPCENDAPSSIQTTVIFTQLDADNGIDNIIDELYVDVVEVAALSVPVVVPQTGHQAVLSASRQAQTWAEERRRKARGQ